MYGYLTTLANGKYNNSFNFVEYKFLPCDMVFTGFNCENNLLQCKARLRTINPSLGPYISESFMHQAAFYKVQLPFSLG